MKNNLLYIIIVLILGCSQVDKTLQLTPTDKEIKSEEVIDSTQELGFGFEKNKKFKEQGKEDCIFDQATQNDNFLKGIKELQDYTWNQNTKMADIVLNDHWSLTITRGGCDHFVMSAMFKYDRVIDLDDDKQLVYDQLIWITNLLEDFDGKLIKETLLNNKLHITKENEFNSFGNFMNSELYELYYFNFNNEDRTTFEIGYYYN